MDLRRTAPSRPPCRAAVARRKARTFRRPRPSPTDRAMDY